MQFGVMLPQTNRVASRSAIVDIAQAAEDLGFDALTVHDHLVFNGWWIVSGVRDIEVEGEDRDLYEALETLTFAAALTKRVRLVASVIIVPLRDPLLLAKQTATLDVLSEGRFTLGVGVGPPLNPTYRETTALGPHRGNAAREYEAVGVSGNRGPRTNEYLEAIIELWTKEKVSFSGDYITYDEIEVFPKPVQQPHPPILIGGRSDAALERTARYGNGWNPSQVSAPQMADGSQRIRTMARDLGRPEPEILGINIHSVIADSDDAADAIARPTVRQLFPGETEYEERTIVGSPDTFVRRLKEYQEAGATYAELKPLYPSLDNFIKQMETIRDEVMPAFSS